MAKRMKFENDSILDVNTMAKDVLFTHTDLDGAGCAVVFMVAYNKGTVYFCGNGADINNTVNDFLDNEFNDSEKYNIIIADNSIDKNTADRLDDLRYKGHTVSLYDHHKSALWIEDNYEWATVDMSKCGTVLLYESLFNKASIGGLEEFCNDVQDRDLWLWEKKKNIRALIHNELLYSYPSFEEYCGTIVNRLITNKPLYTDDEYNKIMKKLKETEDYVNDNLKNISTTRACIDGRGYNIAISYVNKHTSEMGNAVCKNYDSVDFCMIPALNRESIELRCTKEDIDLSVIAKSLNGGGHPKAAGFPLDHTMMSIVNELLAGYIDKSIDMAELLEHIKSKRSEKGVK